MVPECGFQTTSNKTIFQTFRSAALILTTNFLFNISAKLGPFKFGFLSTFPIVSYQAKAKLSGKIKYLAISINGGVQFSSRWWAEPNLSSAVDSWPHILPHAGTSSTASPHY